MQGWVNQCEDAELYTKSKKGLKPECDNIRFAFFQR